MSTTNKKALFNYEIIDRFEAGIVLTGAEVKSARVNTISIGESFVRIIDGELLLLNAEIPPYRYSTDKDYDPRRTRKLLMKKGQIIAIASKMKQGNLTVVPLKLYTSRGILKLEIGLAKGRKRHEKKLVEKERELKRELHNEKRKYMIK